MSIACRNNLTLSILALAAAALFTATSAGAADPASDTNPPPAAASTDCSKSTLTNEKFMRMFHAIAMHGDLHDVAFVEKTLQVKFKHKYVPATKGDKPDPHRIFYSADSLFNLPILVSFLVIDDDDEQTPKGVAALNFVYHLGCLTITPQQFEKYFDANFNYFNTPGGGWGARKNVDVSAKDKGVIMVTYGILYQNEQFISIPSIYQKRRDDSK